MEMRMMVELLAPGMEPGEAADVRPKMLRVSGDVLERLCHGPKEHAVEDAGILEAQGTEGVWQREHHMDIGDIEHFAFPRGEPGHLSGSVTLGAVAVATGIITDLLVATVVTLGFVAPQGGGTADGDGAQGPTLICREGSARACQEEVAILLDHIRHFEAWGGHTSVSSGNASSGLGVACRACGVTWRERLGVRRLRWPSKSGIRRRSPPASRRWVAKACRSKWGWIGFERGATSPACRQTRYTALVVIGRVRGWPGKSHGCGLSCRPYRRNKGRSFGESMT